MSWKTGKKLQKNVSGGIMVGCKGNLAKHIDIVNTDSKYAMWFKYSEQPFKTNQAYCLVLYIYHQIIPNTHPKTLLVNCNRNTCLFQICLNIYVFWGTLTRGQQLTLILLIRSNTDMLMIILLTLLTILQTYWMIWKCHST